MAMPSAETSIRNLRPTRFFNTRLAMEIEVMNNTTQCYVSVKNHPPTRPSIPDVTNVINNIIKTT